LTVVTKTGEVRKLGDGEYKTAYRRSSLRESGDLLVEAVIRADRMAAEDIEKGIRESLDARKAKQPLNERSAGSVFKNPEGDAAGRLVEAAGMKGFRVGGARVSEKHANFIVSDGGTAHDVAAVMREVQKRVREKNGVRLEPEILPMGAWNWAEVGDIWWQLKGPVFFTA
jgi:UDP-N-acetylmuramate dehydrogenase